MITKVQGFVALTFVEWEHVQEDPTYQPMSDGFLPVYWDEEIAQEENPDCYIQPFDILLYDVN